MSDRYRLGLRGKASLGLGGLILLALITISVSGYLQSQSLAEQKAMDVEQSKLALLKHEIEGSLDGHSKNLISLRDMPPVQAILRARSHAGSDPESGGSLSSWNQRLKTIFGALLSNHPQYLQLRLIAADGKEIVRVEKGADGVVSSTAEHELQNKSDSEYVLESSRLETGEVYYSDVTLNREHGIIQLPHLPVLRLATPVFDSRGEVAALIVMNLSTEILFSNIGDEVNGVQRHIVDEKGYYIKHADADKTFGLERGIDYRLQNVEPELVELTLHHDQFVRFHDKEMDGFQKVYFSPQDHSRYWLLTMHIPERVVFSDITRALNTMLYISFLIGLIALIIIVWYVSRKVLAPVVNLARAASRLQEGDLAVRVDAQAVHDEYRTLYEAINSFADKQQHITKNLAHEVDIQTRRLAAVIDNVVDGIITINERGNIESFNSAAMQIFGYTNEEIIGQDMARLMPEPYASEYHAYLEHYMRTGEEQVVGVVREVLGLRKDGTSFPIELAVSKVIVDDYTHFVGITRDITERKSFEKALQQKSDSLSEAQRIARLGNWDVDMKTWQWGWSDEIFRIFGFESEAVEPSYKKLLRQVQPADRKKVSQAFRKAVETGDDFIIDCRIIRGDDTEGVVHLHAEILSDDAGVATRMIGTALDITERKAFEQRILNEESRLKAIIDNVVDGIITINERGLISSFNPAAEKIFGYQIGEVYGENVKVLMPEPYHGEHDGYLSNFRNTGKKKIIGIGREVIGRRKDGSTFPMELAVSEVLIDKRRHFVGITRDITERKRGEQMQKEFISTVSHELRTPLTSIRGSLGLILGGVTGELPEKAKALLGIANNNSERLIHLINDILDVEKIAAGKMHFDHTVTELYPVIHQAIESNKGYADELQVSFKMIRGSDQNMMVNIDEKRIAQVMSNLLSNAAKYSPANGQVEISVEGYQGCARISVVDHGKGIPEEFKSRIFSKFSQADSSDTRQKGGTGLGLNITKAIVEQHGGKIGFESGEGQGTIFYVDLPLYHEVVDSEKAVAERDETGVESDKPLLLIVEDDKDVSRLLGIMLEKEDYAYHQAFSYQQAVGQLRDHHYDAVTLDLMIPGGSGLSLLREIRANDATRDLPVIVVSAKMEEGRVEVAGDAISMVDWIGKPIDEERLLESIKAGLSHSSAGTILHVEDDPDIAVIVDSLLGNDVQVTHVETLKRARELVAKKSFDLVLLDIGLPDGSGLDLLPMLCTPEHEIPVIIFSAQDVSPDIASQVKAVMMKSKTDNEKLMQQIRLVINK